MRKFQISYLYVVFLCPVFDSFLQIRLTLWRISNIISISSGQQYWIARYNAESVFLVWFPVSRRKLADLEGSGLHDPLYQCRADNNLVSDGSGYEKNEGIKRNIKGKRPLHSCWMMSSGSQEYILRNDVSFACWKNCYLSIPYFVHWWKKKKKNLSLWMI